MIAPTKEAINPIRYSSKNPLTLGVNKITIHALTKKAKVPSRLFERNFLLPNFLPISAAEESLIIKMLKAEIKITFGKIRTLINAEIRT